VTRLIPHLYVQSTRSVVLSSCPFHGALRCKNKKTTFILVVFRECRTLLEEEAFDTLLNIAIADPVKRAKNREVWVNLAAFYWELKKPLGDPENATQRAAKSILVEDLAVLYVDSFVRATMLEAVPLYLHLSVCHLPRIVQDHPVDISDLSQQYVENALKQGKMDMQVHTNKRLRDERNDVGRNLQVFKKERERAKLKREVPMPLSRNERRQLADGSKAAEQTVARAGRRGQLVTRSDAQVEKKVAKVAPELQRMYTANMEIQALIQDSPAEEPAPAANSAIPSSNSAGDSLRPAGAAGGPEAAGAVAEGSAGVVGASAGRGRGRGRGVAGRGSSAGGGRGRGRGGRGSRSRPASARDV
jgi:hypothetical protein